MKTIYLPDGIHKYEGYSSNNGFRVKFYEKMGNRWVLLVTEDYIDQETAEWDIGYKF